MRAASARSTRSRTASDSSHGQILAALSKRPPSRILDLGCSGGLLSEQMRRLGHHVTSVDVVELPEIHDRVDRFIRADLDQGLPDEFARVRPYDVAVCADVLEHVREPEQLLEQIREVLVPRGALIASVPNFGHWYSRTRTALGLFDYDQRGILDRGHVRFFTRRSFTRRLNRAGFEVMRLAATGLPLEVLARGRGGAGRRTLAAIDRASVTAWPTLFGYQFVAQCERSATSA